MARDLTTQYRIWTDAVLTSADGTTKTEAQAGPQNVTLLSGVGAGQADQEWHSIGRTLALSTSETFDLAGAMTNAQGETVTLARIKRVHILNWSTDATCLLLVGGNASNAWEGWTTVAGSKMRVGPAAVVGGVTIPGELVLSAPAAAGLLVTAGTGDILKVANESGSAAATYDIIIVGGRT